MSDPQNKIKLFESHQVRAEWDAKNEKWWSSVVDIVTVLTESADASAYWRKLKQRLKEEGNETVTNCHGLKMRAADADEDAPLTLEQRLARFDPQSHGGEAMAAGERVGAERW
jgi:hypothetical protein